MAMRAERREGTPLGEAIALTCAAVFAIVAGSWVWLDEAPAHVRLLVSLSIAVSILAVSFRMREIIWIALGLCLGAGMIGFFSIGMPLLPMGLAVFAWWALAARRTGQAIVTSDDLVWEMVGVAIALVVFALPLA